MITPKNNANHKSLLIVFITQIGLMLAIIFIFTLSCYNPNLNIGTLVFALLTGALGASVSLMRRLQKTNQTELDGISKKIKVYLVLMPMLYGSLMAGVAYLLFMSGILSGDNGGGILSTNLFPSFSNTGAATENILLEFRAMKPETLKDAAKLLVWCFVAGYSEKFVTNVLNQLDSKSSVKE